MPRAKQLTARQRQLFNHMIRHGGTVWPTADHLRIRESTMRRWMRDDFFVAEWKRVIQMIDLIARTDALQQHRAAGTSPDQPAPATAAPSPAPTDTTIAPPPPNPAPDPKASRRKTRPDRDEDNTPPPMTEREWLLKTEGPEIAAQFDAIFGPAAPAAPSDDTTTRHPGEVTP